MIWVIVKMPGKFGRRIVTEGREKDFAELLFAEEIDYIEIADFCIIFDPARQSSELRQYLSPAFSHGFDTFIMHKGKQMQVKQLRGPVVIASVGDGCFGPAPARLLKYADEIK